jgi:DNA-3-methyladenine glycosylase II
MSFVAPPGAPVVPLGLEEGIAALTRRDPDFARIVETAGLPRFPRRAGGFGTLLHIILEQQVSVSAAAAMWAKLAARCAPLTPERFLGLDDATLRECGFSRQKIAYGRHLAEAIRDGRFDPGELAALDDEAAVAALVELKGIGRWSAEVYLLFALGRPDVWPADDLGLQLGAQWLKRLESRPKGPALRVIAETWRPWRSVAACLLWQFYLHRLNRLPAALAG